MAHSTAQVRSVQLNERSATGAAAADVNVAVMPSPTSERSEPRRTEPCDAMGAVVCDAMGAVVSPAAAADRAACARAAREAALFIVKVQAEAFAACASFQEENVTTDCVICGDSRADEDCEPVRHADGASPCTAIVHASCLMQWIQQRNKRSERIRVCPQCRCKLAGAQPPDRRQSTLCGDGGCRLRRDHIGLHDWETLHPRRQTLNRGTFLSQTPLQNDDGESRTAAGGGD